MVGDECNCKRCGEGVGGRVIFVKQEGKWARIDGFRGGLKC